MSLPAAQRVKWLLLPSLPWDTQEKLRRNISGMEVLPWEVLALSAMAHCKQEQQGLQLSCQINPTTNCWYQLWPMQDFLRPDHVTPLKAGPSPSSALRHLVSLAVLPHGPAIPREVPAGGRVSVSWNAPQAGCRAPPSRQNNQRLMEQQWDWRFKKFKLNCTEQRDPSASYQIYSHSFYTGDNNNSKNCTPFPVPPCTSWVWFSDSVAALSYLVNRASLQLQLWHSSLSMQHTQLQQVQQPCVILLLVLGN